MTSIRIWLIVYLLQPFLGWCLGKERARQSVREAFRESFENMRRQTIESDARFDIRVGRVKDMLRSRGVKI